MADETEKKVEARLVRGFQDSPARACALQETFLSTIRAVYRSYGFEPLDTPALEYADGLGKFLPDEDRPNQGVFSLRDDDQEWISLRYDLTAPLARYVALNNQSLPKPFRRYQIGPVWRNEKPGPARFREFLQADADTVGTSSLLADAEMCQLMSETLQTLGFTGRYSVQVSSRKILDGLLENIGLRNQDAAYEEKKLTVLLERRGGERSPTRGSPRA